MLGRFFQEKVVLLLNGIYSTEGNQKVFSVYKIWTGGEDVFRDSTVLNLYEAIKYMQPLMERDKMERSTMKLVRISG